VRVDLVVSAGFTEVGAKDVLSRAGFEVRQISPARPKLGPRPGRKVSTVGAGTTGRHLERELLRVAAFHHDRDGLAEVVVLIDDADCRLVEGNRFDPEAFERWRRDLEERLRQRIEHPDLVLIVLLASPEIEAWFVADWLNGFGGEFKPIAESLRRRLQAEIPENDWLRLEDFGAPAREGGGCNSKLSDCIAELVKTDPRARELPATHREYSKRVHGTDCCVASIPIESPKPAVGGSDRVGRPSCENATAVD
jgi:hypothetical protein